MATLTKRAAASVAAMLALATPQIAMAQDCIAEADLADAAIYAMPLATDAVMSKCGPELSSNGFLAKNGQSFRARYAAMQDEAWPGGLRGLKAMASAEGRKGEMNGMDNMLSSLSPEIIRPFLDALIVQKLTADLPLKDCDKIERGFEAIAPIDPQHSANLIAFVITIAAPKHVEICPKAD